MSFFRSLARNASHIAKLLYGWVVFLATGKTPARSYQSMITLFCLTGGRSNDILSHLIAALRRPYRLPQARGVLDELDREKLERITIDLRKKGYYIFDKRLQEETCDRLVVFALSHPALIRPMDGQPVGPASMALYDRHHPRGVRYDFKVQDLLDNPDIQALMSDLSLLNVAQKYLGSQPILDALGLWWNCAYSSQPDRMAAQLYHFDMDRIKWLKFFVPLTDVGPQNGPHSFVAGSHRTGAIPSALLKHGYARLTDQEVADHFPSESFVEFCAPRGTIVAEDTRGLHKGKAVEVGDRLLLEIQFSNSLFGAAAEPAQLFGAITERARFSDNVSPQLRKLASSYPRIYSYFLN